MARLYRDDDWQELVATSGSQEYLTTQGKQIPYVIFENEDDVTIHGGDSLFQRLMETMARLWQIQSRDVHRIKNYD